VSIATATGLEGAEVQQAQGEWEVGQAQGSTSHPPIHDAAAPYVSRERSSVRAPCTISYADLVRSGSSSIVNP
jgi:hypothetical protein